MTAWLLSLEKEGEAVLRHRGEDHAKTQGSEAHRAKAKWRWKKGSGWWSRSQGTSKTGNRPPEAGLGQEQALTALRRKSPTQPHTYPSDLQPPKPWENKVPLCISYQVHSIFVIMVQTKTRPIHPSFLQIFTEHLPSYFTDYKMYTPHLSF